MSGPTVRVLALLELLQSRGLTRGQALARELGVDPRTLRRYIEMLDSLGIPVVAQRGRDGGYRLMSGFKLPPLMFSNDEALALGLGLLATRSLGVAAPAAAATSALAKLERVMPDDTRQRMRAVGETVALDLVRASSASDGATLGILSAAARDQQSVRLEYRSAQQARSERDVDPYALAFLGGHWYLVGHCHLRQALRSFRLDRIAAATALPRSFGRPAAFDAAGYLMHAMATLPRTHSIRLLLHTDLASARAAILASVGVFEPVAAGTLLHVQADDVDWMARELARLPFSFVVQEPPALREALVRRAAALLECAGDTSGR